MLKEWLVNKNWDLSAKEMLERILLIRLCEGAPHGSTSESILVYAFDFVILAYHISGFSNSLDGPGISARCYGSRGRYRCDCLSFTAKLATYGENLLRGGLSGHGRNGMGIHRCSRKVRFLWTRVSCVSYCRTYTCFHLPPIRRLIRHRLAITRMCFMGIVGGRWAGYAS